MTKTKPPKTIWFRFTQRILITYHALGRSKPPFLVLALAICIGITASACAKENDQTIVIGGDTFTYGQLIADFLDIAFSERLWNEDVYHPEGDGFSKLLDTWHGSHKWNPQDAASQRYYQSTKKFAPWFADYMYRPQGWPRHSVINKWDKEITVAIGWPRYNPSRTEAISINESLFAAKGSEARHDSIRMSAEKIVPEIEKLTGLPTRFLSPDDPRESNSPDYARIRIIPAPFWSPRAVTRGLVEGWLPDRQEMQLWGAVPIESSNTSEMDAYLLPHPDNTLGLVICKLDMDLPDTLFRGLIAECVTRAMGLPDQSNFRNAAFVSDWRAAYRSTASDVDHAAKTDRKGSEIARPTPYDRFMVSLLYCDRIGPGMDKHEVLQALMEDDHCIINALNKQ